MPDRIDRIVNLLAEEFDWDEATCQVCRDRLAAHKLHHHHFEFICDSPTRANFRLKPVPGGGYRVAYYGQSPNRQVDADRITALLAKADG